MPVSLEREDKIEDFNRNYTRAYKMEISDF